MIAITNLKILFCTNKKFNIDKIKVNINIPPIIVIIACNKINENNKLFL